MKELFDLFLTFAKVGVMTFGGGMASCPFCSGRSWRIKNGPPTKS